MKTTPITLFEHEARAAAEGRLGLIVRPVVPQPIPFEPFSDPPSEDELEAVGKPWWPRGGIHMEFWPCPIGQPGDRLWGRESFRLEEDQDGSDWIAYKHGGRKPLPNDPMLVLCDLDFDRWRSTVTMPRWASRFTFEVEAVECRRVQGISEEESWQSGVEAYGTTRWEEEGKTGFAVAWNSHYAKRGLGWDANPWAWFGRVRRAEG